MKRKGKEPEQVAPEQEPVVIACPDCGTTLTPVDCFCERCRAYWAYEVHHRPTDTWDRKWGREPRRACPDCGGEITVFDGYCYSCDDFRAPRLELKGYTTRRGGWNRLRWKELPWDPELDRRCTPAEIRTGFAACHAEMAQRGGPLKRAVRDVLGDVRREAVEEAPF